MLPIATHHHLPLCPKYARFPPQLPLSLFLLTHIYVNLFLLIIYLYYLYYLCRPGVNPTRPWPGSVGPGPSRPQVRARWRVQGLVRGRVRATKNWLILTRPDPWTVYLSNMVLCHYGLLVSHFGWTQN